MSDKEIKKNKNLLVEDDDDNKTGGGTSGDIKFKDFLSNPDNQRDDLLSASEKKILLATHNDLQNSAVSKTKQEIDARKQRKESPKAAASAAIGYGNTTAGKASEFAAHKILNAAAQFQGADKQTSQLPTQNESIANEGEKHEHELQNRPEFAHKAQPGFTPPRYIPR